MKQGILALMIVSMIGFSAEGRRDQRREVRQQARIAEGVKSGELTHHEAKKLRKKQRKIDHMQNKAMEDGVMTPEEKMRIEKAQDRQSKAIYNQKHDEQQRGDNKPAAPAPSPAQGGTN